MVDEVYFERCVARVVRLVYAREEDDRPRPDRVLERKNRHVSSSEVEAVMRTVVVRAFLGDVDA